MAIIQSLTSKVNGEDIIVYPITSTSAVFNKDGTDIETLIEDVGLSHATTEKLGIVKPDGTTISVDDDGTISSLLKKVYVTADSEGSVTIDWDNFIEVSYDATVGIDLSINDIPSDNCYHEASFEFQVDDTVPSFAYPSDLHWATEPSLESNYIYEVSIDSYMCAIIVGYPVTETTEETTSE